MLSRVMGRSLRRAPAMSKMVKPGNYVCFCGCVDGKHGGMISMPSRSFQGHLGLDSTADLVPKDFKAAD